MVVQTLCHVENYCSQHSTQKAEFQHAHESFRVWVCCTLFFGLGLVAAVANRFLRHQSQDHEVHPMGIEEFVCAASSLLNIVAMVQGQV